MSDDPTAPIPGVDPPVSPGPPPDAFPTAPPIAPPVAPPLMPPPGGPDELLDPGEPPRPAAAGRGPLIAVVAVLVATIAFGLILWARSGDDSSTSTDDTRADDSVPTAGALTSVEDLEQALVYIEAEGSFVEPESFESVDFAGTGTGFVIDPSGLAVTNNHVVTGAATLEVFVGGDDEPRNAEIVATSECSDLAVIKIDADDELPFVSWYDGEVRAGLEVFAAGYPLSDPELTLTDGVVSKAKADGETDWASVDSVIEHTARINPGNSGGPLVTEDARVVGVNYASDPDTERNLAIAPATAKKVVAKLVEGKNVEWLGINGQAVVDDTTGESGVWVAAVESGSPAARAGLEGGDIITRLEGQPVGVDGTMAEYCDVLRTQGQDNPIGVQVTRWATEEVLEGTFNDPDDPLEVAFSLGDVVEEETDPPIDEGEEYGDYVFVTDDTGTLEVELPVEWIDIDGSSLPLDDGTEGAAIIASPDIAAFQSSYLTPGVVLLAAEGASDPSFELAAFFTASGADEECTPADGPVEYDDGLYIGLYEIRELCGGTEASLVGVVAGPEDGSFTIVVGIQVSSAADLDALDRILQSFIYVP